MKTDLREQIHELMECGLRPVTMADIQNRAPARVTRLQRTVARSRSGRARLILAGAATIAACVAVAVAALLPGGAPRPGGAGGGTGPARLAAWSVTKQPDGSVAVTLHELPNAAKLQQKLRADGIPARVVAQRAQKLRGGGWLMPDDTSIPGCHVYLVGRPGIPASLWQKIFYGPHTKVRSYNFWIYPAALPPGRGVVIFVDFAGDKLSNTNQRIGADNGYGVASYSLYLINSSPRCTGS